MTTFDKKLLLALLYFIFVLVDVVVTRGNNDRVLNDNNHQTKPHQRRQKPRDKLLIIVIDGFRWDYLPRQNQQSGNRQGKNTILKSSKYPGFEEFMRKGVHTEYIKSVFPSESFPSWQTINTGRYPGAHGIIANQFFDQSQGIEKTRGFFDHLDQRSTKHLRWWQPSEKPFEPIWVTAKTQGVKFSAFLWGRCDVDWPDVKTQRLIDDCENVYEKDFSKTLAINLELAMIKFQQSYDAAIVYEDSLGKAAQQWGPNSEGTKRALAKIDENLSTLIHRLNQTDMLPHVNIVITGDHGITRRPQGDKQIEIGKVLRDSQLLRDVSMIVGSGAYSMIHPKDDPIESLTDAPTSNNDRHVRIVKKLGEALMGQADVYRREEIPKYLHWKENKNTPPILVMAKKGYVINPATGNEAGLQHPVAHNAMGRINRGLGMRGLSGYDPDFPDMRGAFMARGPGFNIKQETQKPIEIVDLYHMFCHLLDIIPAENDGVWDRIKGLLRNSAHSVSISNLVLIFTSTVLLWTFH